MTPFTPNEHHFQRYADLLIRVGLNLQPGQNLLIKAFGSGLAIAPLVRAAVRSAYQAGARYVDVDWSDEALDLIRLQHADPATFDVYPDWRVLPFTQHAENGDAILSLTAATPGYLDGQNPEHLATLRRVAAEHTAPYRAAMGRNRATWCVAAAAVPGWAAKVFPDLAAEEQLGRLWEAIFAMVRLDQPDPIAAWQAHITALAARSNYLTTKQYRALHFRAPGTDLRVGLPAGHLWEGGAATTEGGLTFTPNMPTEEVFTMPHRLQVDGTVRATLPLNLNGELIDGFALRFADGRVVAAHAERGEAALQRLLETDDGARRLGEVALVTADSPIAQTGRLFYNTLFDENAASHLALGRAYRINLPGGADLSDEAFTAAGGNLSLIHTDFMIGSAAMDVDGLCDDGSAEPIMRSGRWAF